MSKVTKIKLDEIIKLYSQGKKPEALGEALIQKKLFPNNSDLLNALGIIYRSLNQLELSIKHYDQAIKINKLNPSFFNNRGNARRDLGKLEEAKSDFYQAVKLKPSNSTFWSNLAKCYNDCGNHSRALVSAQKALNCNSRDIGALNNLALSYDELDRNKEALKTYNAAISLAPTNATILSNYGRFLFKIESFDKAIYALKNAIRFSPDLVEAHYNLCEIYEKTDDLTALEAAVNHGMEKTSGDVSLKLKKALLQFRKKKYIECLRTLEAIKPTKLSNQRILILYDLLAKSCDKLQDFERAFFFFKKSNYHASKSNSAKKTNANRFRATVENSKVSFLKAVKNKTTNLVSSNQNKNIAFLVGFPRSGTTLLDTVLRSHSKIQVIEEKPMVYQLISQAKSLFDKNDIFDLSQTQLDKLAHSYLVKLKQFNNGIDPFNLIIDKFPLNLIHVPFVRKVFPHAKFILLIRHPCDTVLSCFMQNFALNDAMANFLSLRKATSLYHNVMSCWLSYSENIEIDYHQLKYEHLILNFEKTTTGLLEFLELNWEDELKNFYKTAQNRRLIKTPSYTQVTEKLYSESKGRWKNYECHFSSEIRTLQQWIKYFSY